MQRRSCHRSGFCVVPVAPYRRKPFVNNRLRPLTLPRFHQVTIAKEGTAIVLGSRCFWVEPAARIVGNEKFPLIFAPEVGVIAALDIIVSAAFFGCGHTIDKADIVVAVINSHIELPAIRRLLIQLVVAVKNFDRKL